MSDLPTIPEVRGTVVALAEALDLALRIHRELPVGAARHPRPERPLAAAIAVAHALQLVARTGPLLAQAGAPWSDSAGAEALLVILPSLLVIADIESDRPELPLNHAELDQLASRPALTAWLNAARSLGA